MIESLDRYHFRARVQPALLVAVPAGWTLAALALGHDQWLRSIGALIAGTGVMYLIAQVVRDRGRRIETTLWASWGGPPTSRLLEWTSGAPIDEVEYHQRNLRRLLSDEEAGTPELEETNPARARAINEGYIRHLRERTRDQSEHPVVFAENVAYGFRRNLLGLRPLGLAVSALCLLASLTVGIMALAGDWSRVEVFSTVTGLNLAALVSWVVVVTPAWVQRQASNYASALLNAAESLEPLGRG